MKYQNQTKEQLINELIELHQRVTELEPLEKERKRAEEALRGSERTTQALVNATYDSVFLIDTAGIVLSLNENTAKRLGKSVDEILGSCIYDLFSRDLAERRKVRIDEAIRVGKPVYWEDERQGIWFDNCVSPILDGTGKVTKLAIHGRDITERKRIEEEKAVLQEQLRQSQKMEAVGQLAGGIAHDFNNLLTVIRGYSQLSLNELQKQDPLWENMEEIGKAADRASELTHQLLAFSRRQLLEFKVIDLNSLVQGMEKMLRRMIREDIELMIYPGENLGKIKVDPGQIEQVIMNLAVNAKDAMPSGGKLVLETANVELDEGFVRSHLGSKPGRYVRLSVTDTGCGLSKEVRERVFEPFFTTKEKGKGTGLGLSTVYGIMKQSGGYIWVLSELGMGASFEVYLPWVDATVEVLKEKVKREGILQGNETILVVEDEEMVRKLAVHVLKKQGYKVLEAPHGGDALLVCERHPEPIQLVITDVVMPGMCGPELIERLRQVRQDFRVMYMSGHADESVVDYGVQEGEMNFIQKPFTIKGLARKVREVLD